MRKNIILFYLRRIKRLNSPDDIIRFSLQKYQARTFLIDPQNKLELTFSDFGNAIGKITLFFGEIGLVRGDILAFSAGNCVEAFMVRAACHCSGIVFLGLPVNLSAEDMIYFLDKANAKALFYRQRTGLDIAEIKRRARAKHYVELDKIKDAPSLQSRNKCAAANPASIATLNLSSGTTQKTPKIIKLSNENWIESLYNYIRNSDLTPDKKITLLCTVPFLTAGSTTFFPTLLAGATNIIVNEETSYETLAGYINKYKANRLYMTPSRLLEFMDWCKENKFPLIELESITTGTERIPAVRLKEAIDFFGPVITVGYGMVEALPPISMLAPRDYPKNKWESAGRIVKGAQVKILEDKRIAVKSKTVSQGYLDNPDENSRSFKYGWFYTGDYGFLDGDGFLHIWGRKEEMLTKEPRMIFTGEIEERTHELSFIDRCAVIAKDGRVIIFVSLKGQTDPEEAKQKVLEKVSAYALGKYDFQVTIKERLPINTLGKLDRRRLSEEIA